MIKRAWRGRGVMRREKEEETPSFSPSLHLPPLLITTTPSATGTTALPREKRKRKKPKYFCNKISSPSPSRHQQEKRGKRKGKKMQNPNKVKSNENIMSCDSIMESQNTWRCFFYQQIWQVAGKYVGQKDMKWWSVNIPTKMRLYQDESHLHTRVGLYFLASPAPHPSFTRTPPSAHLFPHRSHITHNITEKNRKKKGKVDERGGACHILGKKPPLWGGCCWACEHRLDPEVHCSHAGDPPLSVPNYLTSPSTLQWFPEITASIHTREMSFFHQAHLQFSDFQHKLLIFVC